MKAPSHDIAIYLDAQGLGDLGASDGWRLAANVEASTPDDAITVYDTGGSAPVLFDEGLKAPTIQVRVRSYDYAGAYTKQEEAFDALTAIKGKDLGNHRYVGVWLTSDIIHAGRDENDRHILTANYQVERHTI